MQGFSQRSGAAAVHVDGLGDGTDEIEHPRQLQRDLADEEVRGDLCLLDDASAKLRFQWIDLCLKEIREVLSSSEAVLLPFSVIASMVFSRTVP